jgi:hypothetical protein
MKANNSTPRSVHTKTESHHFSNNRSNPSSTCFSAKFFAAWVPNTARNLQRPRRIVKFCKCMAMILQTVSISPAC